MREDNQMTRDELINILRGWHKAFKQMGKGHERNVQALAEAAGVLETGKWISVKDRLPEPDTKVLVYGRNEYGVYCITCLYSAHRKWLYHNRTTADGETITHWMPLPEPPKEES